MAREDVLSLPVLPAVFAISAFVLRAAFAFRRRSGVAFTTALGIVLTVATLVTSFYRRVMFWVLTSCGRMRSQTPGR
jgi:hypothetical protein